MGLTAMGLTAMGLTAMGLPPWVLHGAPLRPGTVRFRLSREAWERRRREDIEILGLEPCLDLFVGPPRG